MKIVVLGKNGMLGHMVLSYLDNALGIEAVGTDRVDLDASGFVSNCIAGRLGGKNQSALPVIKGADYVINCIGTIKPCIKEEDSDSVANAMMVNSMFPRFMADYCEKHDTRMIHITTDCVYIGESTNLLYERTPHNAQDVYGKSKSLGEPENCMNIRTSIIGPEKQNHRSFLEWVLSNEAGSDVYGFTNHLWNGVTTLELSRCLYDIIGSDIRIDKFNKLFHIHSPSSMSKYKLVDFINKEYELDLNLKEAKTEQHCYRSLGSTETLCVELQVPPITKQLENLSECHSIA